MTIVEFAIGFLKHKKEEIIEEYKERTDIVGTMACKKMCDDLDNAISKLEYEYYWKNLSEKQIVAKLEIENQKL